jgi:hypothetical protein
MKYLLQIIWFEKFRAYPHKLHFISGIKDSFLADSSVGKTSFAHYDHHKANGMKDKNE